MVAARAGGAATGPGGHGAVGLFVYGTLRFPDVLRALLGRVPDLTPATARGWRDLYGAE